MLNRRSKIRLITVTNDKLSRKRAVTFFFIAISHIKSLFVAFAPFEKAGEAGDRHNWSTASSSCRPFYLPTLEITFFTRVLIYLLPGICIYALEHFEDFC